MHNKSWPYGNQAATQQRPMKSFPGQMHAWYRADLLPNKTGFALSISISRLPDNEAARLQASFVRIATSSSLELIYLRCAAVCMFWRQTVELKIFEPSWTQGRHVLALSTLYRSDAPAHLLLV